MTRRLIVARMDKVRCAFIVWMIYTALMQAVGLVHFIREKIPTLRQGLQLIKRSGTKLNIELKTWPDDDVERLCLAVSEMIKSADIPNEQILFSSFDTHALMVMKRYLPAIRRGQLWDDIPDNALETLQAIEGLACIVIINI